MAKYRDNSKPSDEEIDMAANGEMPEDMEEEEEFQGVTEDDLHGIISAEIDDAVDYIDDVISPERAAAGEYYKGEPFGNEEEGRSQVVSMDVRDTVQAIMPSIMRVFFSANNVF